MKACESIPVETIGVWCSGGADSTILLYNLLVQFWIKDCPTRSNQCLYVGVQETGIGFTNIIEHIQDRLNVEFLPHETY